MVDTTDEVEEHSGASPPLSVADGGSSVSREKFNVALDMIRQFCINVMFNLFCSYLLGRSSELNELYM